MDCLNKNSFSLLCCNVCKCSECVEDRKKRKMDLYETGHVIDKDFDKLRIEIIKQKVDKWPVKYFLRFQKWYVNRCEKDSVVKGKTFADWAIVNFDDCIHHLDNWDNGLKKATLKDDLIDRTRNIQRRYRYQEKRYNQRSAQYGTHPHLDQALQDKDLTGGIFKYSQDLIEGEEQGDSGQTAIDLEISNQNSSTANITFVDERPLDSASLHVSNNVAPVDTCRDINENLWNMQDVLTREYPVEGFEWKVGDKIESKVYKIGVPQLITNDDNCLITRQLKFFSFLKAGVKIRVQLNGTKFHCGRLLCFFKPLTWDADKDENFYGLTCYPHFFLDASVSNSGEIEIPFTHLLSYFSQESYTLFNDSINSLGEFSIMVFNDLRAADNSSQSLYGQVFASLISPSVHLPTSGIQKFSYSDGYMQSLEGLLKGGVSKLVDSGLGLADSYTGGLATGIGNVASKLLGNCDKPTDPTSASPIINRTVAPLCHGAGLDRSVRLGLSPVAQTTTDPGMLGATDGDFNLLTLCKMPSLLETVEWTTSQARFTKLFDSVVSPVYISTPQYSRNATTKFASYNPTMLAYISRGFCYWRGDLKMKIQVVSTQFHSGRLYLVYDPHGTGMFNLEDFDKNKSHNIIVMDLQEQQELVVNLPYYSVRPWLRCDHFRSQNNIKTGDLDLKNPTYLDCDASGIFRIYVANPLVRPNNVTDKVQVNIFFYAGDNFELSVINPVAPLSNYYINENNNPALPRYLWCKEKESDKCNIEDVIYSAWEIGARLYSRGFISQGDPWYKSTVVVKSIDALEYQSVLYNIRSFVKNDESNKKCVAYVNALPKFGTGVVPDALTDINQTVSKTEENVEQVYDKLDDPIIIQLGKLQEAMDKLDIGPIKKDTELINGKVDKLQINDEAILSVIQSHSQRLANLKTTTDLTKTSVDTTLTTVGDIYKYSQDNQTDVKAVREDVNQLRNDSQLVKEELTSIKRDTYAIPSVEKNVTSILNKVNVIPDYTNSIKDIDGIVRTIDGRTYVTKNNIDNWIGKPIGVDVPMNTKVEEIRQNVAPNFMVEQGLESYTTTRENDGGDVVITHGKQVFRDVAAETLSENAMDLQTLLRRYYPLYVSPDFHHTNDFTLLTIPVTPTFKPKDSEVGVVSWASRSSDIHNLAWWARLLTYHRGSMRYKILVNAENSDIYVWHGPLDAKSFSVVSGFKYTDVATRLNYASDVAVTRVQQGVEVEIPFYSGFNQLLHSHTGDKRDLRCQNGTLYIAIRNKNIDFNVSVFISTGDDFVMNILRAPPVVYEISQAAYSNYNTTSAPPILYPEFQHSAAHTSSGIQVPGTAVFDRFDGTYADCANPPTDAFADQDFNLNQLPEEKQQMEEQMLTWMLGADSIKETYNDDVLPMINDSKLAISELKLLLAQMRDGTEEVRGEVLPKLNKLIDNFDEVCTETKSTLKNVNHITGSVNNILKWTSKSILYGAVWYNLQNYFKNPTWLGLLNIVISLSAALQISQEDIMMWLRSAYEIVSEGNQPKVIDDGMTEQSFTGLDDPDKIATVLSVVATSLYVMMFGGLPTKSEVKKCLSNLHDKSLMDQLKAVHFSSLGFKAINNVFEVFSGWMNKVVYWFIGRECQEAAMEKVFKDKSDDIMKWIDEVAALEDEDFALLALSDIDIHNKFYALADKGKEFTKWLMMEGVSKNVSSVIRDTNRRLHEMITRINAIRPGHGFRYSPFTIMLDGPSSVGKSNMMHRFTDMLREELDIPYYNSVFAIPTTAKYLDGYQCQPIIEWDDMLQCPEQDIMVAEFINWRSNADCITNKADVKEKGMHFLSKAIVMSTNNGNVNVNMIRDMEAFRNRINVKFEVDFAEGHSAEGVKSLRTLDPDFKFAKFTMTNAATKETIDDNMTFDQALEAARACFRRWNKKQEDLLADYFNSRGTLRIPRGIVIEKEEFADAQEQGGSEYVVKYTASSDLDKVDCEIFKLDFADLPEEQKAWYYEMLLPKYTKKIMPLIKRKFNLISTAISDATQEFYLKHPRIVQALGVLSMLGMGLYLYKSFKSMGCEEESTPYLSEVKNVSSHKICAESSPYLNDIKNVKSIKLVPESSPYLSEIVNKPSVKIVSEASDMIEKDSKRIDAIDEQGAANPETIRIGRSVVYPALSVVGWCRDSNMSVMQCMAIGGKIILLPHHFFRRAKDGERFWFTRGKERIFVEYDEKRCIRIREKDACLYYMGAQFNSRRALLDYFVSESDLTMLQNKVPAVLVGSTMDGVMKESSCVAKGNTTMRYSGRDEGAPTYVQYGWEYNIDTVNGDCGSLLLMCSNLLQPPSCIAGIHTAGYSSKRGGFSVLITREMIAESLQTLIDKHGNTVYSAPLPGQVKQDEQAFNNECFIIPQGDFSYCGVMDKKMCPSQPSKTSLRATPFQGELYPVQLKPAHLTPVDGQSPLKKALDKYGKLTYPFSQKHIKMVRNSILNDLLMLDSALPYEPTTLEVAIFGVDGMKYVEKLNFNSSPGWPYQCLPESKGHKGKAYLFDIENKRIAKQSLVSRLEIREIEAKKGNRVPSIWRDCLKDELRPIAKVDQLKTRLFTIAPVDFTILTRKYFLPFVEAFYKGHNTFFSAVGINPESYEWTESYNRLKTYGNKCVAGDFQAFDGTLMAELMAETGELIDDWFKCKGEKCDESTIVRRVLFDEMIHTFQLVNNCVYKTHKGNPSGNPLTVIINTIVNAFYMRLAWLEIMTKENPNLATMQAYQDNVIEEIFGDDNRLVIKDPVLEIFNQVTIAKCLLEHGITYTDECKSGILIPYKELESTSFLKRTYRWDSEVGCDIALPVMEKRTIQSLTNWVRKGNDEESQLLMNQRAALGFAFFHGRQYFDEFNGKFSAALRDQDIKPLCFTYDELLDLFISSIRDEGVSYSAAMGIEF